jgi:hypothetical protein
MEALLPQITRQPSRKIAMLFSGTCARAISPDGAPQQVSVMTDQTPCQEIERVFRSRLNNRSRCLCLSSSCIEVSGGVRLCRVTLTNLAIALHLISCCSFRPFKNSRNAPPSPSFWHLNILNGAKRLNDWNVWNWPQHALAIGPTSYGGHLSHAICQLLYTVPGIA